MNIKKRGDKRGQVTIFVIIAVIIIVLGILIYMFLPRIKLSLGFGIESPSAFMQTCLGEEIQEHVDMLSLQGGTIHPTHYFLYQDSRVAYLCYSGEYHELCAVQQPFLKEHIEEEIKSIVDPQADECFESMKENYEKAGYEVVLRPGDTTVELLPKRIVTSFDYTLALKKGDDVTTYGRDSDLGIRVMLNNNLYELVGIASSILSGEATYGDVEVMTYMSYYSDLKVEKKKQSDGTTIYILTDINNNNKFQFASRSLAWPPGYGLGE